MSSDSARNEQLFLGSILTNPSRLMDVRISENHFLSDKHKIVFQAIQEFERKGELIDVLSVGEYLGKQDDRQNWLADLTGWAESSFSETFFDSAQKIIQSHYRERQIKVITHELAESLDTDAAIQSLMELDTPNKNYTHSLSEALGAAVAKTEQLARSEKLAGKSTGLKLLDDAIAGFQDTDLYVIGGRPAMGKTAIVLNLMLNNDCPAGFISTEQPMEQIGLRSLSIEGGVSSRNLRSGKLHSDEWPKLITAVDRAAGKNITIYDKPNITIAELMREARRMKFYKNIEILYVDYIQRIKSPTAENRRLEVADVVTSLKTLARELSIPVVALGQVSREVEKRADKRPGMSDLLESGVIEQEADVVMLLYRDEVYNPDTPDKNIIEINIGKNRHGPIGEMDFAWIGDNMKVGNLMRSAGNF